MRFINFMKMGYLRRMLIISMYACLFAANISGINYSGQFFFFLVYYSCGQLYTQLYHRHVCHGSIRYSMIRKFSGFLIELNGGRGNEELSGAGLDSL